MKSCPACGEHIKDDAIRCRHCGTDLALMKCPWCAEIIEQNARRCRYCKSYLTKIQCAACNQEVEVIEMRCTACTNKSIANSLNEYKKKMTINSWLAIALLAAIAVFVLSKIF